MQRPLTVAINAQINPHSPGGTESALLFLIKKLGEAYTEEKFALLSIKKHAEKLLPFMGPNETITAWPFPEVGYMRPTALNGKWENLPRAARRLTPVIEALYRRY